MIGPHRSAPPSQKDRRRRAGSLARVAVFGLVSLALILSPWESTLLHHSVGLGSDTPAGAQSPVGVIDGDEDLCDTAAGWNVDADDEALCVLKDVACPDSMLGASTNMQPSSEFPDFCEESVSTPDHLDATYVACGAMTGVVVEISLDPDNGDFVCTIISPASCSAGLHRTGPNECTSYQRRTWTCSSGIPLNQFDTCYVEPPSGYTAAQHPACQNGAPSFAILDCANYVGVDYVRDYDNLTDPHDPDPAIDPLPCATSSRFDTGDPSTALRVISSTTSDNNNYWCKYDSQWLDVNCHATTPSPPCTAAEALCLKRASQTGGCDAVAQTIFCRSLQADFAEGSITEAAVHQDGCAPCVPLPYSPYPSGCPANYTSALRSTNDDVLTITHKAKADFYWSSSKCDPVKDGSQSLSDTPDCQAFSVCADPPSGSLQWNSSHESGMAVVNSLILVDVIDIPLDQTTFKYVDYEPPLPWTYEALYDSESSFWTYPGATDVRGIIREWDLGDGSSQVTRIGDLVSGGECYVQARPSFVLIVEQLWPDVADDAAEISRLFGNGALDWWNATGFPRESFLAGQGFTLLDNLADDSAKEAEIERRHAYRATEVLCHYDRNVWCRWIPRHSGYFSLKVAGAWKMKKFEGDRTPASPSSMWDLEQFIVRANANALPGGVECKNLGSVDTQMQYGECILLNLQKWGYVDEYGDVDPQAAGFSSDLSGIRCDDVTCTRDPVGETLTLTFDARDLYSSAKGTKAVCPSRDLRMVCGGEQTSANYTLSESHGVVVHETRVNARRPSIQQ